MGARAEKSEDQRGDCDVPNNAALAEHQCGHETETKRLRFVRYFVVALDENDISGPDVFEARLINHEQRIFRRVRIPEHDAGIVGVSFDAQQHHVASIAQTNDGRECLFQMRKPVPIEFNEFRPHAGLLGTAHELTGSHVVVGKKIILD